MAIFLLIWAVYVGYPLISILVGLYLRRKLSALGKSRRIANLAGVMITVSLLLLPFADYPKQRHTVNRYCSQEGGFHITGRAEAVEGVHGLRHAIDYGYFYGEDYRIANDPSTLYRYYVAPPNSKRGKFFETKTDKPSPYGFRRARIRIDGSIFRVTLQTYRTDTKEELGRFVYFENNPTEQSLSVNDFRKWMRMTCDGVDPGAFPQMRVLLHKSLSPVESKQTKATNKGARLKLFTHSKESAPSPLAPHRP